MAETFSAIIQEHECPTCISTFSLQTNEEQENYTADPMTLFSHIKLCEYCSKDKPNGLYCAYKSFTKET